MEESLSRRFSVILHADVVGSTALNRTGVSAGVREVSEKLGIRDVAEGGVHRSDLASRRWMRGWRTTPLRR